MHKLCWFAGCFLLWIALPGFPQTSNKEGWGPWRSTNFIVEGIQYRSKCISSSGSDSQWNYQFRSRYDQHADFLEREEHGIEGVPKNEWNVPQVVAIEGGQLSPVLKTQLHGRCAEVRELKIEIFCVAVPYVSPRGCFEDPNGQPYEFKPIPDTHGP
jgi:hypothetical protein